MFAGCHVERLLPATLALVSHNILRSIRVSLKKERKVCLWPLASFELSHSLLCLFLQHLSRGSSDMPALHVEVTQAWEAAAATDAAHIAAVLAVETSAQEAATAQDSAAIHMKDAEDRAALVKVEALERVSRVEVEKAMALASTPEDHPPRW
jgi:hypothetical protein